MDKFRVCGLDEDGYPQVEASDLSYEEAVAEMNRLKNFFPDTIYFVDVQGDEQEQEREPMRRMNTNGIVDGWEDFFPDYE
tara:strand:+ start:81 stop:320 length:240 start_codon:yes stop_codon:yes gene_type:complete